MMKRYRISGVANCERVLVSQLDLTIQSWFAFRSIASVTTGVGVSLCRELTGAVTSEPTISVHLVRC